MLHDAVESPGRGCTCCLKLGAAAAVAAAPAAERQQPIASPGSPAAHPSHAHTMQAHLQHAPLLLQAAAACGQAAPALAGLLARRIASLPAVTGATNPSRHRPYSREHAGGGGEHGGGGAAPGGPASLPPPSGPLVGIKVLDVGQVSRAQLTAADGEGSMCRGGRGRACRLPSSQRGRPCIAPSLPLHRAGGGRQLLRRAAGVLWG